MITFPSILHGMNIQITPQFLKARLLKSWGGKHISFSTVECFWPHEKIIPGPACKLFFSEVNGATILHLRGKWSHIYLICQFLVVASILYASLLPSISFFFLTLEYFTAPSQSVTKVICLLRFLFKYLYLRVCICFDVKFVEHTVCYM